MSQLIVCRSPQGIILASDSRAVVFGLGGEVRHKEVNRMTELTSQTAILTGGAAEGVEMVAGLKGFLEGEGLQDIQDVLKAARPFLASEYDRFMRELCDTHSLDPIHHVYFVLGGFSKDDPQNPFRLYLLWTKRKLPQLDCDEITVAFTAPRLMGLEYKLNRLCQENKPLEEILPVVKEGLKEREVKDEEVGAPFRMAVITREGFKAIS